MTHPRMLRTDTHLGLILSGIFYWLIGRKCIKKQCAYSSDKLGLLSQQKTRKKHLLQLELELFIQGWFGKLHSRD